MSTIRQFSPLDRLIIEFQHALGTSLGQAHAERPNPAAATPPA